MKFFQYKKTSTLRVFSFLGLPIYEMIGNYRSSVRIQKFFGGLFRTERICDELLFHVEKIFRVFNISFLKRVEDGVIVKWYLFNILFNTIDLKRLFIKEYAKLFGDNHDYVFILSSNSGEACIFLTHVLDAYIKKNKVKTPLIVATKKYHVDLIKSICPEIPYKLIKPLKFQFKDDIFNNGKQNYFLVFSHQHFLKVLADAKNMDIGNSHYYTSILSRCGVSENEVSYRDIKIPVSCEQSMLAKVGKINLNLDKFVLLCPEALSAASVSNLFWVELIKAYQDKGYDVFVNLVGSSINLSDATYKSCFLSYPELFALACRAKKIVSLRSGVCEYLLQTKVPMDILYSNFHYDRLSPEEGFKLFSMQNLKSFDKDIVSEFIIDDENENIIKEKLLNV